MTDFARTPQGKFAVLEETIARDSEAAKLWARGWTHTRIGTHYGVTRQAATQMIHRALNRAGKEDREEALAIELAKCDMREQVILEVLARKHYVVNQGKLIYLNPDDDGAGPLEDDDVILRTMTSLQQVADHRAKLRGLYAPTRVEHKVTDAMTAEIQALAEQLGVTPDVPGPSSERAVR